MITISLSHTDQLRTAFREIKATEFATSCRESRVSVSNVLMYGDWLLSKCHKATLTIFTSRKPGGHSVQDETAAEELGISVSVAGRCRAVLKALQVIRAQRTIRGLMYYLGERLLSAFASRFPKLAIRSPESAQEITEETPEQSPQEALETPHEAIQELSDHTTEYSEIPLREHWESTETQPSQITDHTPLFIPTQRELGQLAPVHRYLLQRPVEKRDETAVNSLKTCPVAWRLHCQDVALQSSEVLQSSVALSSANGCEVSQ